MSNTKPSLLITRRPDYWRTTQFQISEIENEKKYVTTLWYCAGGWLCGERKEVTGRFFTTDQPTQQVSPTFVLDLVIRIFGYDAPQDISRAQAVEILDTFLAKATA